jgi:isoleucyl-tRNA synthetase
VLRWTAEGAVAQALTEHGPQVAAEVLATAVHAGAAGDGDGFDGPGGLRFWVARA